MAVTGAGQKVRTSACFGRYIEARGSRKARMSITQS